MSRNNALAERPTSQAALANLERVVVTGDLSNLSTEERIGYYARVTESLGLNPLTRPFEYITLNGRLTLYARKDASDQLRKVNGISVDRVERERDEALGLAIVTVYGHDRSGRTDSAIGAVSIKGVAGEALANALMKAETKAKRRMTLSLAGLGWLDESEIGGPDPDAAPVTSEQRVERIVGRAEALEAAQPSGELVEVARIPFSPAPSDEELAAWMRKVHAAGAERGIDHDGLHALAVEAFEVESLNDLDADQREKLAALVEARPLAEAPRRRRARRTEQPGQDHEADHPVGSTPAPASCSHPASQQRATAAGIECGACGATLAVREDAQPGQARADRPSTPAPASTPAEEGSSAPEDPPPATTEPEDQGVPPTLASPADTDDGDPYDVATRGAMAALIKRGYPPGRGWDPVNAAIRSTGRDPDAEDFDWQAFADAVGQGVYDELVGIAPRRRRARAS